MNKTLLLVVLLVFCQSRYLNAESGRSKLEELEQSVAAESARLERLQSNIKKARKGIAELSEQIVVLRKKEQNSADELRRVIQARDVQVEKVKELKKKYASVASKSAERLKVLYMQERQPLTFRAHEASVKASFYSSTIRQKDLDLLQTLTRTSRRITASQRALDDLIKNSDRLASTLRTQRQALSQKLTSQKKAVSELEVSKQKLSATVTNLRAQALRLETIVAGMIEAPQQNYYQQESRSPNGKAVASKARPAEFDGKGLAQQKSELKKPLPNGKLVKRFGKHKVAGFKEMVFNKGLEFHAPPSADVYAVAPAVVLYTGDMPAFGTFVILNHGQRSYSLYGRLSEVLVKPKQVVSAGSRIARLLPEGEDGADVVSLYFEVRQDGKPLDPLKYFGTLFD